MGFHPLYRGTWYLTITDMKLLLRCSRGFHPLYRGTWYLTNRYALLKDKADNGFHPLYRGTWYLTVEYFDEECILYVSIRYIAVLGI